MNFFLKSYIQKLIDFSHSTTSQIAQRIWVIYSFEGVLQKEFERLEERGNDRRQGVRAVEIQQDVLQQKAINLALKKDGVVM